MLQAVGLPGEQHRKEAGSDKNVGGSIGPASQQGGNLLLTS